VFHISIWGLGALFGGLRPHVATRLSVYSVNVGEFMSWPTLGLRFKLRVEVSDNEVRSCI